MDGQLDDKEKEKLKLVKEADNKKVNSDTCHFDIYHVNMSLWHLSDTCQASENQERRNLQAESEKMERILNARSMLLQKKDECERRLSDVGSLPLSEVEKLKGKDVKSLVKQLHSTNNELKKFSHVNKKVGFEWLCRFKWLRRRK